MSLRIALVLLVCLVASVLQSTLPFLFHARDLRADLLLAVVLYLSLHDDVVQGAALSLCAGYLGDLISATPSGLYTFLAVLTFVVVRMTASAFKAEGGLQAAVVAFGASLVHSFLAALLFRFIVPGTVGFGLHAPFFWSAGATGLGAIPIFAILRRIDASFLPVGDNAVGRGG